VGAHVTNKVLTIANLLSLIRLLLVPVFFVLFTHYHNDILAFIVFVIAAGTDWIDGQVARATHTVSKLGQQLDPLVDRVLIIIGVISVFIVGRVPLWVLVVLVARDAVMFCLTIYMRRRWNRSFKVIFLGKLTTAVVMAGFASLVLAWPLVPGTGLVEVSFLPGWGAASAPLGIWLLYVGMFISWTTGIIYLYRGTRPTGPKTDEDDAGAGEGLL